MENFRKVVKAIQDLSAELKAINDAAERAQAERDLADIYNSDSFSDFDGWRMTNHDGRGGDE